MQAVQDFMTQNAEIVFPILAVWALIWKGLALYKAARKEAKGWFVVLLIINTVGILEILYFFLLHKVQFNLSPLWAKVKGIFQKKA